MPELFGPLPRHAIAGVPLAYAVAAPLVAAGLVALFGPSLDERPGLRGLAKGIGARSATDGVAALGAVGSALVVGAGLVAAATSPSGVVVSPAWVLARTGSIEATLGFDADLGRSVIALVLALATVVVALRGGSSAPSDGRAAWRSLALAAALAGVLADGLGTALLALGGAVVATGAGSIRGRWLPGGAAILALTLAGATLAWGLDGRWLGGLGGNFLSDYGPRFAAVRDGPPQAVRARGPIAEAKGSVTMTSAPGAEVYVGAADDASLRGRTPVATAPFRAVPIAATIQKIAIVPGAAAIVGGDGLEVALADNIDIRPGDDVVVTPLGATWVWRDIEAQLLVRDAEGKHPLRSGLATKQIASMAVPTAVVVLVFLAAFLAWIDGPRRIARALATRGPLDAALVAAALAVATIAPAARLSSLVPLASAPVLLIGAALLASFGVLVASSRGRWFAGGVATIFVAAALVAIAADAPPVLALAVALASAVAVRFVEKAAPRPAPRWIAGPDEGDALESAPSAAVAAVAEPGVSIADGAPQDAQALPKPKKKKKSPKNPPEARS